MKRGNPVLLQRCLGLSLALGAIASALAEPPRQVETANWIGAEACGACHTKEYRQWKTSHHALAMQEAKPQTVLGDFDNTHFEYGGRTTLFSRKGDSFLVHTEGPDGKDAVFPVIYTFGVHPLQQYLIGMPGGRLQALSIAWDSRPAAAGGQRWFHLYPTEGGDEAIDAAHPLHWTGPYQNWNARCAECHSTGLQKNYAPPKDEYRTTWSELNVACEACHGPGGLHRRLAQQGKMKEHPAGGFAANLAPPGHWIFGEGEAIAHRVPPPRGQGAEERWVQLETCALCHSRRSALSQNALSQPGRSLLDTHLPALLEASLYHVDGQIREEVYVYGSFLQSRMHQAGVVCTHCHEPHGLGLRAEGNGVCLQCHQSAVYNSPVHHHHKPDSSGAECANCHMPETAYMVVDPRRDHSIRIPRPDLSMVLGTPNACTMCHQGQSNQWALAALGEWGVHFRDTAEHPARILAQARRGDVRASEGLRRIALDSAAPAIRRATAAVELGAFANRDALETARHLLGSEDPLLRLGAVRALEFLPIEQLLPLLRPHLKENSTAVRMEMARVLAAAPLAQLAPETAAALGELFEAYLAMLALHGGMPEAQMQLGSFHAAQGRREAAEAAYSRALQSNPQLLPALMNLADLYRQMEREEEARDLLLQAHKYAPESGGPPHALGLLEFRVGNREAGMKYLAKAAGLEKAAAREEGGIPHRYVYAIALHDNGQVKEAILQLKETLGDAPSNPDILVALIAWHRELGQFEEARRYAARLRDLAPGSPVDSRPSGEHPKEHP